MSLHLSWIEKSQWQDLLVSSGLMGGVGITRSPQPPPPAPPKLAVQKAASSAITPPPLLEGTLEQRLVAFFNWIKTRTDIGEAFIADEHGLAIVADEGTAGYSAASTSACHCMENFKLLAGSKDCDTMTLFLSTNEYLQIIGGRISWGWFTVGLITPTPMSLNDIRLVRDTFFHKALGSSDQGDLNE